MAETMKPEDENNLMALLNQYEPHHPLQVKYAAFQKAWWDQLIAKSKTPEAEAARAARIAAHRPATSRSGFKTTEEMVLHYKNMSGICSAHPCHVRELALDHPLRLEYMDYIRKNVSFEDVSSDEVRVFPEMDPYRVAFCAYLRTLPFQHTSFTQAELLPLDDEHRQNFVHYVAETIPDDVTTVYAMREYPKDHPLRVKYAALLPQFETDES